MASWGLSTSPGTLFLGASYSILKGQLSTVELESLAEWLVTPTDWYKVNSTIHFLLSQAEIAGDSGFGKVKGMWELVLDLPWQKISYVILALGGIPSLILAVEKILRP